MKGLVTGLLCLFVLFSHRVYADETTNAASFIDIGHRTDGHNHLDTRYLDRLKRTCISAFVMAGVNVGLHTASEQMFYLGRDTPGIAMGVTGLFLSAGLTPIFYLANRSAFRRFNIKGNSVLQTWGWIASSLAVADVITVVAVGFGASIKPLYGLLTLGGVFSAIGFSLFAIDSLLAMTRVKSSIASASRKKSVLWSPYVTELRSPDHKSAGAVMGIAGAF